MSFWEPFKEFFAKGGWSMLKDNPVPLMLTFVLAVIVTALWYQERISVYEERIVDYKERLGEVPKETKYTRLTNKELKQEASNLVSQLREFQRKTVQEEARELHYNIEQIEQASIQRNLKFQKEFLGEVRSIAQEMQIKLPNLQEQVDDLLAEPIIMTGMLIGNDPIGNVANHIEKIANLLPVRSNEWFSLCWQDNLFLLAVFIYISLLVLRQIAKYQREKSQPPIPRPSDIA